MVHKRCRFFFMSEGGCVDDLMFDFGINLSKSRDFSHYFSTAPMIYAARPNMQKEFSK